MNRFEPSFLAGRLPRVAAHMCLGMAVVSSVRGLEAQVIQGRLLTAYEDSPIEFGRIALISAEGDTLTIVSTDGEGRFALTAPAAGRYWLRGTAALHEPLTGGPAEVGDDQTIEVEFRLLPQAFELDTLDVSVARRIPRLARVGFYDRAREGHGHFITQEEIDRDHAYYTGDLLRGIPGVHVQQWGGGPPAVYLRRRASFEGGTECVPTLYIDGFLQSNTGTMVNDVPPEQIAGIEVYTRQVRVPSAYGHGLTGCGVILIWTRR